MATFLLKHQNHIRLRSRSRSSSKWSFPWVYKRNDDLTAKIRRSSGEASAIVGMIVFHWSYTQNEFRRRSGGAPTKPRRLSEMLFFISITNKTTSSEDLAKRRQSSGETLTIVEMIHFHWYYKQTDLWRSPGDRRNDCFSLVYKQNDLQRSSSEALAIVEMSVFHSYYKQNNLQRRPSGAPAKPRRPSKILFFH